MKDRPTNQTQTEQPIHQLNRMTEESFTLPPRLQTFRNWRLSCTCAGRRAALNQWARRTGGRR